MEILTSIYVKMGKKQKELIQFLQNFCMLYTGELMIFREKTIFTTCVDLVFANYQKQHQLTNVK